MFRQSDNGVVIGNGRSGVRLSRIDQAAGFGYPTLIEVRAGPFSGSIIDVVGDYCTFLVQLESLYSQLSGQAALRGDESFSLSLTGGAGAQSMCLSL